MNPWPAYEVIKRHWRETGNRLTEKEVQWRLPGATRKEIREGMIEFDMAYERSFKYEAAEDAAAEEASKKQVLGFDTFFKQLEARNGVEIR